ncbi:hypothetical protein DFH09DRAFT_1328687 [Mycena vulgaris]|nr:hypothetical protein DFH09DRAFT_1328687 [Mycena vulgaris]
MPNSEVDEDQEILRPVNLDATRDELIEGTQEDVLGYKPELVRWAKHFLLTQALFLDTVAFGANPGQLEPSDSPQDQFSSDEAYTQGITTAIYQHIPVKFHLLVDAQIYSDFAKDFIREHSDGRSSVINAIRNALPLILDGLNIESSILTTAKADRSKSAALADLLCFPQKKLTLYAPVLFPGRTQNMAECFTGPIIMKVHRVMLFGPSSLIEGNKPAANSNGVKLGIKGPTPTSISTAATLARFVLSRDTEWASKGAISGTEWEAEYRAYHKMLTCNIHLPHVKKIFKKVQAFVFAGVIIPSTGTHTLVDDSDVEDDINDAMRRFELAQWRRFRRRS